MARGRPRKNATTARDATKKQIRDRLHYISEATETDFNAAGLSFSERRLLMTMADPSINVERWTIGQVCEAAGVGYLTYKQAMANPEFTTALNAIVQGTIKQAILPLVRAGVRYAMDGSFRHWEVLMRMGGQIEQGENDKEVIIRFAPSAGHQPVIIDAETTEIRTDPPSDEIEH